jgi:hypothetical protein
MHHPGIAWQAGLPTRTLRGRSQPPTLCKYRTDFKRGVHLLGQPATRHFGFLAVVFNLPAGRP